MSVKKEYTKDDLTVVWNSSLCSHSAKCARNLKAVFDPSKRPWINMEGAPLEEIRTTVGMCPSGALSIKEDATDRSAGSEMVFRAGAPLAITGSFTLTDANGNIIETGEKAHLCRCGASGNQPFCDGSHKKAGFDQ